MIYLRETKEGLLLAIRVIPRSARDEIVGTHGNALKIRLNAPPVDGKANARLLRFLGERLGASPSCIQIVRGQASREKQVLVTGLRPEELRSRLDPRAVIHLIAPKRKRISSFEARVLVVAELKVSICI